MAQLGKQAISIHILPDISGSKGNQTMKIAQSTGYNMSNSFLEKSYTKCGGATIPRRFSEKPKLSIFLDQQSRLLYWLFLLYFNFIAAEIYWN